MIPSNTTQGAKLIADERARQMAQEGWTPEHDDTHQYGDLAVNAAILAVNGTDAEVVDHLERPDWNLKRHPRIEQLVIAGALIAAEIDRVIRRDQPTAPASPSPEEKAFHELSLGVQQAVECLARDLRANVGDDVIKAQFITTPATCSKCRKKFHATTTGKMLKNCPYCDGTLVTDSPSPVTEETKGEGELAIDNILLPLQFFDGVDEGVLKYARSKPLNERVADIAEWMRAQKQVIRDYVALKETNQYQRERIDELEAASPTPSPSAPAQQENRCPQCKESVIKPRHGSPYCENCGWPDENRPDNLDDVIDDLMFAVLEVVAPEGSDPEEQEQVRNALAKSLGDSRIALPAPSSAQQDKGWAEREKLATELIVWSVLPLGIGTNQAEFHRVARAAAELIRHAPPSAIPSSLSAQGDAADSALLDKFDAFIEDGHLEAGRTDDGNVGVWLDSKELAAGTGITIREALEEALRPTPPNATPEGNQK